MRNAYLDVLYDLAKKDARIFALVADNGAIVYDKYRQDFPGRFFNFGISEANMISVAAGLAACGKIPFAYTISNFLTMRAFEQIRNDICLQKMNVKLVGIGAGFVYSSLGPTHHATEDIALMRTLPDMTILCPADSMESRKATLAAANIEGPVYLRLATGGTPVVYENDYDFIKGRAVTLREGRDAAIIATGGIVHEVVKAACELEENGISVKILNMHTVKPVDKESILRIAREIEAIITVEEHSIFGGLGSSVAEVLAEGHEGYVKFDRMGLKDVFPSGYGSYDDMKKMNGLSSGDIVRKVKTVCGRELSAAGDKGIN